MTSRTAIGSGTPAAHRNPRTALDSPAIDSTERSISPAMMISVIGSAMIATSISAASRFAKLPGVRKNRDSCDPMTIITSSTTSSSVSQRASSADQPPAGRRGGRRRVIGFGSRSPGAGSGG